MGYNENCKVQTCIDGCCNYYGKCPSDYENFSSSKYNSCSYYYYSSNTDTSTTATPLEPSDISLIYGLVFGIFGLIIILCIAYRCYKNKQQYRQTIEQSRNNQNGTAVITTNNTLPTETNMNYNPQPYYNQPQYPNYNQPPMNNNYGQINFANQIQMGIVGQPQGYGQPGPYQMNYNQGPIIQY